MQKKNWSEAELSTEIINFAINKGLKYTIKRLTTSPILNGGSAFEITLKNFNGNIEIIHLWGELENNSILGNVFYSQSRRSKENGGLFNLLEKMGYSIRKPRR